MFFFFIHYHKNIINKERFMEKYEIIKNIAKRSGGDIYLGIVGAVRTGK